MGGGGDTVALTRHLTLRPTFTQATKITVTNFILQTDKGHSRKFNQKYCDKSGVFQIDFLGICRGEETPEI